MGYLVISLKIGQKLRIGNDIEILISDFEGGRADLAIAAPKELAIKRLPTHAEKEGSNNGHKNNDNSQHK